MKDKQFWIIGTAFIVIFLIYWVLGHPGFKSERIVMFVAIVGMVGTLIYYIRMAERGDSFFLRTIPGLKAVEEAVGRSTEMGKPVLYVPGIMDMDQVETVAGVIVLGHVAKMTARYETSLNVPVSRAIVMKSARESVRESYTLEGRPDLFHEDIVHYLTDDQFAFAAGVNGIMNREKPAACLYMGKFYAESLILAETGNSIGAIQIAGTASQSQIPFFVTACDYTLIGEEFFAASAYLSQKPELLGGVKGQDMLKAFITGIILFSTVLFNGNIIEYSNLPKWKSLEQSHNQQTEMLNEESWKIIGPYERYMGVKNETIINDSIKIFNEYSLIEWEDLELDEKENFAKNISEDLYWKQIQFSEKQDLVDIEYSQNNLNQIKQEHDDKAETLNGESWSNTDPYERYMGVKNETIINDSVKVFNEYSLIQWEDLELNEKENFAKNISEDLYWKQLQKSEINDRLIEWGRDERVLPSIKHFLTVQ